jgi:hypothetical protein
MRLNQLAKKVGKPYTRVEKFIRKDLNIEGVEGPNSRVDDEIINKVISKFGLFDKDVKNKPKVKLETVEAKPLEISSEERGLEDITLDYATPAESVVPNLDGLGEIKDTVIEGEIEGEVIADVSTEEVSNIQDTNEKLNSELEESDKGAISEILETEETTLHIDKEGTIIANKIELEGIKVRGKIEIPGVTDKPNEIAEETELTQEEIEQFKQEEAAKLKSIEEAREIRRKQIDKEAAKALAFKEKRVKDEQDSLMRKIEKEKEKKKEAGKKHYLNNVQQPPKPIKAKKKKIIKIEQEVEKNKSFETKEKFESTDNMTAWQKIVRWFNT